MQAVTGRSINEFGPPKWGVHEQFACSGLVVDYFGLADDLKQALAT